MHSEYKNISRSLAESAAKILKGETLKEEAVEEAKEEIKEETKVEETKE